MKNIISAIILVFAAVFSTAAFSETTTSFPKPYLLLEQQGISLNTGHLIDIAMRNAQGQASDRYCTDLAEKRDKVVAFLAGQSKGIFGSKDPVDVNLEKNLTFKLKTYCKQPWVYEDTHWREERRKVAAMKADIAARQKEREEALKNPSASEVFVDTEKQVLDVQKRAALLLN